MTLLGINFLNVSITALVVIYVFVCLLMVLLVLMQRPKQEGLGAAFGANTTDQLFGARTTNVLQKGTVYCAVLFFVLTLTLAILVQKKNKINSLTKAVETPATTEQTTTTEPAKSLSEELPTTTTVPVEDPAKAAEEKAATTPVEPSTGEKPAVETPPTPEKPAETTPPSAPPVEDKTPPQ